MRLVGERLDDPSEGLVLVKTGHDAHQQLDEIAARAEAVRGEEYAGRAVLWTYTGEYFYASEPNGVTSFRSSKDFRDAMTVNFRRKVGLDQAAYLRGVGRDLLDTVLDETRLSTLEEGPHADQAALDVNMTNRARSGKKGHTDPGFLTVWLGATQPGLTVRTRDNEFSIEDVPERYALIWRGDCYDAELAISHSVNYRSAQPRLSAVVQV